MSTFQNRTAKFHDPTALSPMQRVANRFTVFSEKWVPNSYVIAALALLIVCVVALSIGTRPVEIVESVGDGYWDLIPFTYQMALVLISGYSLAACRPVHRFIDKIASFPKTGPGAIAFTALMSIISALLNWGFGMIFSAFLVMALARRRSLSMDFRAGVAAAIVGNGGTAMLGLSSTTGLLHASPESMSDSMIQQSGVIPFSQTILTWQNGVVIALVATVAVSVAYFSAPRGSLVRTADDLGVDLDLLDTSTPGPEEGPRRPGDWLSNNPILTIILAAIYFSWIVLELYNTGLSETISNLNNYIFICLSLALLLHWRIRNFLKSVHDAVPAVGAILIQFPIYAAVASVIITAENDNGTSISGMVSGLFNTISGEHSLPLAVGVYSVILGVFIPSAGAKWILEAPYVLQAANDSESHLGWITNVYSAAENVANLLNPFWMLPVLGIVGLSAKSVMGRTALYFIFIAPTLLLSMWLLSFTFEYIPPVQP